MTGREKKRRGKQGWRGIKTEKEAQKEREEEARNRAREREREREREGEREREREMKVSRRGRTKRRLWGVIKGVRITRLEVFTSFASSVLIRSVIS